jgi:hypothetical protein
MKNVFWDITAQFVLNRRHITSPLESSRLMLCKISGVHCGDYEECRLLGYKNPVRTKIDVKRHAASSGIGSHMAILCEYSDDVDITSQMVMVRCYSN